MFRITSLLGMAAVAAMAGSASASTHVFDFTPGDPGSYGINNNGGQFERVQSTYSTATQRLTFSVTFSNQVTRGFTLAINNGANPKGHGGEMALFYFDANNLAAPKLTAYNYNGLNSQTSWIDGDGNQAGNQSPDLIRSNTEEGWIQSVSAQDVDGKRILSFSIDASSIIGHNPMYGNAADWTGAQFTDAMGIWMHPFRTFNAGYNENGGMTSLQLGGEGWFDGTMLQTVLIPLPSSAAMAGVGMVGLGLRRRR